MIPFISNAAVTEVNSSGNLNDKAGSSKSKLPIQIFRLTDNVSGNLTMTNNSAHKKIFLDTNGNNITNSTGSPITNNSSTALEIIGSGNVQSTLKTFSASESSDSHTGTTTISNSDSSTLVVDDGHTFSQDNQAVTFSSFGSNRPIVPSGTTLVISGSNVTEGTTLSTAQTEAVLGTTSSHKIASVTAGINSSAFTAAPGSQLTGVLLVQTDLVYIIFHKVLTVTETYNLQVTLVLELEVVEVVYRVVFLVVVLLVLQLRLL